MLDWMKSSLRIGLSKNGVTVLRISRWHQPRITILKDVEFSEEINSAEQLTQRMLVALDGIKTDALSANVVLADELVRYFSVSPPRNVTRLQDCISIASLRFQKLYDMSPTDWKIEATWSVTQPFLACALPRWLISALSQIAAQHKLHMIGIHPQFVCAWNQWRGHAKPNVWFGLIQKQQITCCPLRERRPIESHSIFVPEHARESSDWLKEQLQRTALMLGMAPPNQLQLCGAVKTKWLQIQNNEFLVTSFDKPEFEGVLSSDGVSLAMQGFAL